jgi:predicted hexulose-6-phosphate isomerase
VSGRALSDRPVGVYEKALPPLEWPDLLAAARDAGFDFVELSIDESAERLARLAWPRETRAAIRRAIQCVGIPIHSICLSAHRRYGFGSTDPAVRDEAARILQRAITLAADLGVRVIQIAGYFAYYERLDANTRRRYVDGLRRGVRLAAEHGVMLGVENIDTGDMASADDAVALVRELASPWFRAYPDVGNFAVHELDVIGNVARVAPLAVGIHLKDTRAGEPRRVPFGAGAVPFDAVFARLARLPYDGPFTIEMWNDDPMTAVADAAAALTWLRARMRHADDGDNADSVDNAAPRLAADAD